MTKEIKVGSSVFLIAFALGLNVTGVTPILGELNDKYQNIDTSIIQLLQTLPNLLIMAGSLMVGWLSLRFSKKKIALAGLALVGICGIAPYIWDNFYFLFLSRLLIGFGFGIIGPLNTAIVAEVFEEAERARYLGMHVVGMSSGAIVGNMFGGILAGIGYRYFFLAYLVAFISLAGVQVMLLDIPVSKELKKRNVKLNSVVYVLSFATLAYMLFISVFGTNIGIYIRQNITKNTTVVGNVMTVNAIVALAMGLSFSKISKKFGVMTLPTVLFAGSLGFLAILILPGYPGIYIGSILCGICQSGFPGSQALLISLSVEKEGVAKASGFASVFSGIGGLSSPIIVGTAASNILGQNTAQNQFTFALLGLAAVGAAMMLAIRFRSRHTV